MTTADRYAMQDAVDDLAEGWAAEQAAINRGPRLTWGPYSFLPLEDVPTGILIFHFGDPDEPPEVKTAIAHELRVRLQDLQQWAKEQEGKP
jgi:hypothetical protein